MRLVFLLLALLTLVSAVAAVTLRQLIHCALCLAAALVGLALLYLQLGAQFVGLAQVLVYVGAVAILILFTILLTRGSDLPHERRWTRAPGWGVGVAGLVFLVLAGSILSSRLTHTPPWPAASVSTDATAGSIGTQLMTDYVLPLELAGLFLTAALIGAAVLASREPPPAASPQEPDAKPPEVAADQPKEHP
jgi:NADH-quinone oxidoreductase subunit J